MSNEVFYGDFDLIPPTLPAESHIEIQFQPIDLITFWRRCGLTANFAATFFSYCYQNNLNAENSISTILNELLENAAKFSKARSGKIDLVMKQHGTVLLIEVKNYVSDMLRDNFEKVVKNLITGNIDEKYFAHLESKQDGDPQSGIGYLMMYKDYPVRFGYRLKRIEADNNEITVRAFLNSEEI